MKINKPRQIILTDGIAVLGAAILSILSSRWFHTPAAIHFSQLLVVAVFAAVFAASLQYAPHHQDHRRQYRAELVMFGLIPAALALGNYLLFFARHGLSPAYLDGQSSLHLQAMTVAFATLCGCQFFNFLVLNKKYTSLSASAVTAAGLGALFLIIYLPFLQPVFMTSGLDVVDILCVLGAVGIFSCFRSLQTHTRAHTRHVVLALHQESGTEI